MVPILILAITVFLITGASGFRYYKSSVWNVVDTIYYPLAAIGILLLFANNAAQRQLIELNQLADLKKGELRQTTEAKPDVKILTSDELTATSLKSIEVISEWHSLCQRGVDDPRCPVAEGLFEPVSAFLRTAQQNYPSQEQKLLGICVAADGMLDDISKNKSLWSVSDDLISQYKLLISKDYGVFDYEAIDSTISAFETKELANIEILYRQAFSQEDDSTRFVRGSMQAQVHFATSILRGLFPCVTAPSKQLIRLSHWNTTKQSQEEEIRRIESERQRLKEVPSTPFELQKWHLKLWPFVLIFALSLKFGKGVAMMRKGIASERHPAAQEAANVATDGDRFEGHNSTDEAEPTSSEEPKE